MPVTLKRDRVEEEQKAHHQKTPDTSFNRMKESQVYYNYLEIRYQYSNNILERLRSSFHVTSAEVTKMLQKKHRNIKRVSQVLK